MPADADDRGIERQRVAAVLDEAQRSAGLGAWWYNRQTGRRVWSTGMYGVSGVDPAAGPAGSEAWESLVHPVDRDSVRDAYARMFDAGEGFELDYRLLVGERTRWVHASARPDPDQPGCYGGTVQDVTRASAAERALHEYRAHLTAIVESSHDAIVAHSLDGTITNWNGAAERLLGYPAREAIGASAGILASTEPDGAERALEPASLGSAAGCGPTDVTMRAKDGTPIVMSLTASPILDADGAMIGVVRIGRDLSERRRLEDALAASQLRLARAESSARLGIWERDLRTNTVTWSAGLYNILKLRPEELNGNIEEALAYRVHADDRAPLRAALDRAARELASIAVEHRASDADGNDLVLAWRAKPIVDDTGTAVRVLATIRDITEARRAQLALSTASSRLTRFSRELHDLTLQETDGAGEQATDRLSDRQIEILRLIARGLTNAQIAARLSLSEGTVKWHIKQILVKTNASNRTDAVARVLDALGNQLDQPPLI